MFSCFAARKDGPRTDMFNEKQSIKSPVKGAVPNAVILGAGVSGLSTAYEFLQAYPGASCTIVAETLPGDTPNELYASYWVRETRPAISPGSFALKAGAAMAGCAVDPGMTDLMRECSMRTGKRCAELVGKYPDIPLAKGRETDLFVKARTTQGEACLRTARIRAPQVEEIPSSKLPAGISLGYTFDGYTFDPPRYLPWLRKHLEQAGVTFIRRKVSSVEEAASFDCKGKVDIIFNCTGTGSIELDGVNDTSLMGKEAYALIVNAAWLEGKTIIGYTEEGTQSVIARPGGTVHLGAACLDDVRATDRMQRVLKKSVKICPALLNPRQELEVVEQSTAFRPCRKNGLRIEREMKELKDGSSVILVHNYGHCESGYEMSFGSAQKAVDLMQTCF